jgi:hypothetical protein
MTKIEKLKQKYKDMWIAIKVTKRDDEGNPLDGELVAKSNDCDEIWNIAPISREYSTFITFTGPAIKKGYAAAFFIV